MNISKKLIEHYAQKCDISVDYAVELIEESIQQQKHLTGDEAEKVVRECLEIIVRTIK